MAEESPAHAGGIGAALLSTTTSKKVKKMKHFLKTAKKGVKQFAHEESGAQVIEYALIIALVSIALAGALSSLDLTLTDLQTRISNCLSESGCGGTEAGGGGGGDSSGG